MSNTKKEEPKMTADEIRGAVEAIAARASVTMTATYVGLRPKALDGDTPMDRWSIEFTARYAVDDAEHEDFDFFTVPWWIWKMPEWKPGTLGYDGGPYPHPGTLLYEDWQKQAKPQAPHMADVLRSLILDSSAVGQSFENWCSDFGYDTDSRKAEATYLACQKNADKLTRIFNQNDRQALVEALSGVVPLIKEGGNG